MKLHVGIDKLHLLAQAHQPLVLTGQDVTIDIGKVARKADGSLRIVFNLGHQRIEAIEQKVRIELGLQGHVAGLQGCFFQLARATIGGKQVFVKTVADRLADNDQLRQPRDEQQTRPLINQLERMRHVKQELYRYQQQVIEQEKKGARQDKE